MQGNFSECLKVTVDRIEKGYVVDNGGPTKYGVTIPFLRDYWRFIGRSGSPTMDDIRKLLRSDADAAYRSLLWEPCRCDELPAGVDLAVFDSAVNSDPIDSAKWLQRALACKADGQIGPVTLGLAVSTDPADLLQELLQIRWTYMQRLSVYGRYSGGWGSRLLKVQHAAMKMIYAA